MFSVLCAGIILRSSPTDVSNKIQFDNLVNHLSFSAIGIILVLSLPNCGRLANRYGQLADRESCDLRSPRVSFLLMDQQKLE